MDSIVALLDRLETIVVRGGPVRPTRGKMVDAQEILGLLRMARAQLPGELHRAQRLREEAEALHQRATDEARRIILEAEAHARRLLDESPALGEVERRRVQMLEEAEVNALRIRRGADAYAARVLADLGAELQRILGAIDRGKAMLDATET